MVDWICVLQAVMHVVAMPLCGSLSLCSLSLSAPCFSRRTVSSHSGHLATRVRETFNSRDTVSCILDVYFNQLQ